MLAWRMVSAYLRYLDDAFEECEDMFEFHVGKVGELTGAFRADSNEKLHAGYRKVVEDCRMERM